MLWLLNGYRYKFRDPEEGIKSMDRCGFRHLLERVALLMSLTCILPAIAAHGQNSMYRLSESGRYLVDDKGRPFFWQGDTDWELLYALSAQDAKELLHARRVQGFTVVQAMCDGIFPKWIAPDRLPPSQELMPWTDNNPLTPNEAFFRRMDAIVASAEQEHLLLLIGVYHVDDVKANRITLANVGIWTRWLANRYKDAPGIIWTMYSPLDSSAFPMVRAAVSGLRMGDAGTHLVTLHPEGAAGSSSVVQADLSFNTFQSLASGYLNYQFAQADFARTPVKPIVNGEARYEEDGGTTPFDVRRSAWLSYLAGAGFSYGHINNWKSPGSWREWVNSPGARQVAVVGSFLRSLPWWRLIPDQSVLIDGSGDGVAARSADGDWIAAYLPTNAPVRLKLTAISSSRTALVSWINPLNGERRRAGRYSTSARPRLTPPENWQDSVLLVEKALE
jgi:uncharacterized protein DUF4038/collagenase-like protein with putative collagen-binding domain